MENASFFDYATMDQVGLAFVFVLRRVSNFLRVIFFKIRQLITE
jgi:hypothetical protein